MYLSAPTLHIRKSFAAMRSERLGRCTLSRSHVLSWPWCCHLRCSHCGARRAAAMLKWPRSLTLARTRSRSHACCHSLTLSHALSLLVSDHAHSLSSMLPLTLSRTLSIVALPPRRRHAIPIPLRLPCGCRVFAMRLPCLAALWPLPVPCSCLLAMRTPRSRSP